MPKLPNTRLRVLATFLKLTGRPAKYWDPEPQYARWRWWSGRAPPPGHFWAADAAQSMLGREECERLLVSPYSLRRRLKPAGAAARPRVHFLQGSIL